MTTQLTTILNSMLALQTTFNEKVNKDWRNANYPFVDAIWTEAAEAYDHTRWEWWKKQNEVLDLRPVKLELIDIWHFVMSELLTYEEHGGSTHVGLIEEIYKISLEVKNPEESLSDIEAIRSSIKDIVKAALMPISENRVAFLMFAFIKTMNALCMTWEELYKLYVGKNTLNLFRQNNGYKTDTAEYKSRWAEEKGWEDNDYLTEILENLDTKNKTITDIQLGILDSLQNLYNNVKKLKMVA